MDTEAQENLESNRQSVCIQGPFGIPVFIKKSLPNVPADGVILDCFLSDLEKVADPASAAAFAVAAAAEPAGIAESR